MVEKIQVSLWLRKDLKHIVDNEDLNLTKFVNDSLETYFSVSNLEELDEKLKVTRETITILEKKRADLVSKGAVETKGDGLKQLALQQLKQTYRYRRNREEVQGDDIGWIRAPKNLERCRILRKDPKDVLVDLKEWFYGEEKK